MSRITFKEFIETEETLHKDIKTPTIYSYLVSKFGFFNMAYDNTVIISAGKTHTMGASEYVNMFCMNNRAQFEKINHLYDVYPTLFSTYLTYDKLGNISSSNGLTNNSNITKSSNIGTDVDSENGEFQRVGNEGNSVNKYDNKSVNMIDESLKISYSEWKSLFSFLDELGWNLIQRWNFNV